MLDDVCLLYITGRDSVNEFPTCWPNIRCFRRSSMTLWATVLRKCMVRWRWEGRKEKGPGCMDDHGCMYLKHAETTSDSKHETLHHFVLLVWVWVCLNQVKSIHPSSVWRCFFEGRTIKMTCCVFKGDKSGIQNWFYSPQNHPKIAKYISRSTVWYPTLPIVSPIPMISPFKHQNPVGFGLPGIRGRCRWAGSDLNWMKLNGWKQLKLIK